MAGVQQVSFTSPYSEEAADIERRRALAQALQAQGQQGLGPTEMVGGWAIPKSPWEGLGKAAQQVSGAYQQKQLKDESKALGERYQSDLARTLMQAQQAGAGSPAVPSTMYEDASGNAAPTDARAAVAPDRQAMIRALMGHPATQQMGMAQMQQDMQRQAFMAAAGMGGAAQPQGAAPAGGAMPGQGAAPATPQGAQSGFGGPAGGQPMAVWLQLDPTGKAYTEHLAKDWTEQNKPQNVRPQGTIAVPDGKGGYRQAYYSSQVGEGMTRGPTGDATIIPGYLEGQGALGKTPLQEVTNADGTKSFIPKAQLAGAANSAPIPQAPVAPPPQAQPPAQQPSGPNPNNFGNLRPQGASTGFQQFASPAEGLAAMDKNLQAYGSKGINTIEGVISRWAPPSENNTAAYISGVAKRLGVDPKQPLDMQNPAIRQALGTAIMIHEKGPALFAAEKPAAAPAAGPPRFGQTQEEQIRQDRERAAGKEVDQTFAKDYVAFTTGGAQDAVKQIAQLGDVVKQLNTPGTKLTGPFIGGTPDALLKFNKTGQNAIAMRERVEEVVQRSLRAILGAQFTEKEGERLIARAYNPNLSEKENAIRVERLATQLQQAYASKQDAAQYFQKNNTLQGWKGKMPSMADFDPEAQKSMDKIGRPKMSDATREFLKSQGIEVD